MLPGRRPVTPDISMHRLLDTLSVPYCFNFTKITSFCSVSSIDTAQSTQKDGRGKGNLQSKHVAQGEISTQVINYGRHTKVTRVQEYLGDDPEILMHRLLTILSRGWYLESSHALF